MKEYKTRPCKECGEIISGAGCLPCIKKKRAARYLKNKVEVLAHQKAISKDPAYKEKRKLAARLKKQDRRGRIRNKAEDKIRAKKWRENNKDKTKAQKVARKKKHPEQNRITLQNRRARKKAAGGRLSKAISEKLFKLQKGKCACCKLPLGDDFHLDHIMPLALGGANTDENIQLLRSVCNLKKNAQHPIDYMQGKGFLL